MADRDLDRDAAAHVVAEEVSPLDLEDIEHSGDVVGQARVAELALDVGRAAVPLHLDGADLARLRELADPRRPVVRDRHERAVEQHERIAAAMDLVLHLEPIDLCVTRRRFLLSRDDG